MNLFYGDGYYDSVGDGEVPTDGLALGILHRVDGIEGNLGVRVKGTHVYRQIYDIGVVQSTRTFAEMANELAGRDGGVDCAGVMDLLVPRLLDDVAQ